MWKLTFSQCIFSTLQEWVFVGFLVAPYIISNLSKFLKKLNTNLWNHLLNKYENLNLIKIITIILKFFFVKLEFSTTCFMVLTFCYLIYNKFNDLRIHIYDRFLMFNKKIIFHKNRGELTWCGKRKSWKNDRSLSLIMLWIFSILSFKVIFLLHTLWF